MNNNKPYIVKPRPCSEEENYLDELGIKVLPSDYAGAHAELPDGWTFKIDKSDYLADVVEIYDSKKRVRVRSVHYTYPKRYMPDDRLIVFTRYKVRDYGYVGSVNYNMVVMDEADGSIIFSVVEPINHGVAELTRKCEKYLDENYPEWKNPSKYWD